MQQTINRLYGTSDLITIHTGLIANTPSTGDWIIWNKPKNCKLVSITCIGGGGGGGGGRLATASNTAFGGGGGGSGAVSKLLIPAIALPDTLYLKTGIGGTGGLGATAAPNDGAAGIAGSESFVCVAPYDPPSAANIVLRAAGGSGGGAGTAAAVAAAAGGTASIATACHLSNFGINQFLAGGAGTSGNSGGATGPTTTNIPNMISGGAGGGGVTGTVAGPGGSISLGISSIFTDGKNNDGSFTGSTQGQQNASNGINYGLNLNAYTTDVIHTRFPLISTGGTGGTGNNAAAASRGACGGFGSGGGGGGGANGTGGVAGDGGNGGPGVVIIISIL